MKSNLINMHTVYSIYHRRYLNDGSYKAIYSRRGKFTDILYSMKNLLILFIMVVCYFTSSAAGLKLSSNGRYLTTSDGTPYLVMADAAWNLLHMLSTDSAKWYLSQRAQEGFNTFEIWLPSFASDNGVQTWPVTNRYGDAPFTGTPFQSSLNEAYWAHADTVIDYGISLGLSFVVFPAYAGYLNNTTADGGWGGEIDAATNHQMYVYGQTFGARYKNRTNIIWGMGGDMKISDYPTTWVRQDSMLKGIQNASDTHLVTNHSHRNTVGIDAWNNNSRITLNNIYIGDNAGTDTSIFRLGNAAWGISPARPYYLIEGRYESDPYSPTQQTLRAQAYQTMLLGGCGFTFGNSHLFNFGGDGTHFQNYLNTTGSNGQTYAKDLFTSRHWWNLVPDNSHTVLTAGYGTFGTSTYAIAASATDSSSIIAYLPTQRSITINPAVLKGDSIHVWWYNPSNTSVTDAGMYSKVSRSYNQPSPGDWVIVIDGNESNFTNITVDDTQNFPHEFSLHQNYPNPFNPITNIVYTLPRRVHVTLDLYNILGQHIECIVDEIQSAGYHQVKVDGEQLTSGLYLYRMEAGNFIQTKKLIILK